MYISVKLLTKVWKINPQSIIHVGAHNAEEYDEYERYNWIGTDNRRAIWVEAQKNLALNLRKRLPVDRNIISNFAVWHTDFLKLDLNIASSSQSSSLFDFDEHLIEYPMIQMISTEEVSTRRLDSIINESHLNPDFLNLDVQGAELVALQSLGDKIKKFKWIYTEVNFKSLYKNTPLVGDLDEYLSTHEFKRIATYRVSDAGWGDALYIKKGNYSGGLIAKIVVLGFSIDHKIKLAKKIIRRLI